MDNKPEGFVGDSEQEQLRQCLKEISASKCHYPFEAAFLMQCRDQPHKLLKSQKEQILNIHLRIKSERN